MWLGNADLPSGVICRVHDVEVLVCKPGGKSALGFGCPVKAVRPATDQKPLPVVRRDGERVKGGRRLPRGLTDRHAKGDGVVRAAEGAGRERETCKKHEAERATYHGIPLFA